jgi:hypothetical protein
VKIIDLLFVSPIITEEAALTVFKTVKLPFKLASCRDITKELTGTLNVSGYCELSIDAKFAGITQVSQAGLNC